MDQGQDAVPPLRQEVVAALRALAEIATDPKAKASDRSKARNHLRRRLKQIQQLGRDRALAYEFMSEVEELIAARRVGIVSAPAARRDVEGAAELLGRSGPRGLDGE
jgi:hypothetical protein